jgi:hypothetical protein
MGQSEKNFIQFALDPSTVERKHQRIPKILYALAQTLSLGSFYRQRNVRTGPHVISEHDHPKPQRPQLYQILYLHERT